MANITKVGGSTTPSIEQVTLTTSPFQIPNTGASDVYLVNSDGNYENVHLPNPVTGDKKVVTIINESTNPSDRVTVSTEGGTDLQDIMNRLGAVHGVKCTAKGTDWVLTPLTKDFKAIGNNPWFIDGGNADLNRGTRSVYTWQSGGQLNNNSAISIDFNELSTGEDRPLLAEVRFHYGSGNGGTATIIGSWVISILLDSDITDLGGTFNQRVNILNNISNANGVPNPNLNWFSSGSLNGTSGGTDRWAISNDGSYFYIENNIGVQVQFMATITILGHDN